MAAKKSGSKKESNSATVTVKVPAAKVAIRDIELAAAAAARAEGSIPDGIATSVCQYELSAGDKQGDERTYEVTVSWGEGIQIPGFEPADEDEQIRVATAVAPAGDSTA